LAGGHKRPPNNERILYKKVSIGGPLSHFCILNSL